ncbi:MAG: VIT domain-containing protein [Candidatus Edwardsbacteria bacterium]
MKYIILILGLSAIAGLTSLSAVSVAEADGVLIPMPPHPNEPFPPALSIKYHKVEINIDDQVARTRVDQVFLNPSPRDLEATYIFPIPEGASVSKFSMYTGDEELRGEILDKNEARKIYEDIVRRKKDPALLEYVGRDMFKARVYPVPARGEKRIRLDYSQILKMDGNLCEYRYSLNTEKFSAEPIEEVRLRISLTSTSRIKSVYSPTHDVQVNRQSDHSVEIEYAEKETKPDKDFILYYTVSDEDLGLNLLTYRESGEKGFFIAMISPGTEFQEIKVSHKDILFVLDHSGSMRGEKLAQAKEALLSCLDGLNAGDRFNLIVFNDEVDEYRAELLLASQENLWSAKQFIRQVEAGGSTNIHEALLTALRRIKNHSRPGIIIFLTDGLPTVGVQDISKILTNVKRTNEEQMRLFTFGVGYDVNTQLLDRLASENKGISEYVRPEENIEAKVSNFYSKIANPVLTDLALDFGGLEVTEIYPKVLPDLFKGSQLLILGRYEGQGGTSIILRGNAEGKRRTYTYKGYFPKFLVKNDFIPRLWAGRKIGYLIEEIRSHGENKELVDEIVYLSKKYGIMTEYTSFLVDLDEKVSRKEVESKAGRIMAEKAAPSVGGSAVNQSMNARALQFSAQVPPNVYFDASGQRQEIKGVSQIGQKTFFNKKGNWVDNEFLENKQKIIQVKRFSKAYFQLLGKDKNIGQYLALGENVLFNVGRNSVQIGEVGKEEFSKDELDALFR